MHDAVKVVRLPQRVDLPRLHLEEVILLAWGTKTQVYHPYELKKNYTCIWGGEMEFTGKQIDKSTFKMLQLNSGV